MGVGDGLTTVVPHKVTPTGVGIASAWAPSFYVASLRLLSPCCGVELIYSDKDGPDLVCVGTGGCRKKMSMFDGIETSQFRWGDDKSYSQWFPFTNTAESFQAAVAWVERWTGLTDVVLSVEIER